MSNSIVRAFLISFGNSFDLATNFNLYRFFSSYVKSLTKRLKKIYGTTGLPEIPLHSGFMSSRKLFNTYK